MNIYFAGSIVGDSKYKPQQQWIVEMCEELGHVVVSRRHAFTIGTEVARGANPREVFERDVWWLVRKCDVMVAEMSVAGFGLGFETALAGVMGMPVLGLRHETAGTVSAFVLGNTFWGFELETYGDETLREILGAWLKRMSLQLPKRKGKYIAFEGLNRCGKGTQVKMLEDTLKKENLEFESVYEPGSTGLGKQLRYLLQEQTDEIPAVKSEVSMFMAQRAHLVEEVVVPALENGKHVISDRSDGTSLAFQGSGREQGILQVATLNGFAVNRIHPDVVFYLRIDRQTREKRGKDAIGKDRFEFEAEEFEQRCYEGYEKVMELETNVGPQHWHAIDATNSPEEIHREIWKIVKPMVATK